jgi:hypothetical protein
VKRRNSGPSSLQPLATDSRPGPSDEGEPPAAALPPLQAGDSEGNRPRVGGESLDDLPRHSGSPSPGAPLLPVRRLAYRGTGPQAVRGRRGARTPIASWGRAGSARAGPGPEPTRGQAVEGRGRAIRLNGDAWLGVHGGPLPGFTVTKAGSACSARTLQPDLGGGAGGVGADVGVADVLAAGALGRGLPESPPTRHAGGTGPASLTQVMAGTGTSRRIPRLDRRAASGPCPQRRTSRAAARAGITAFRGSTSFPPALLMN